MSELNPEVLKAVQEASENSRLTCARAHEIAETLQVPLALVGQAADQLKIKICKCQLGCF